jgi:hypothetical protein
MTDDPGRINHAFTMLAPWTPINTSACWATWMAEGTSENFQVAQLAL